jgi:AcrR family transcriptional regulator
MTPTRRRYRSPLRDEQARRTRAQILDALIELVDAEGADVSINDLAERAGVATATVYRYFPNRPALLDGLADHLTDPDQDAPFDAALRSPHDLVAAIPAAFEGFDRSEAETRAFVLLNLDPARTATASRNHLRLITQGVRDAFPDHDQNDATADAGLLHLLGSSRTWLRLRDEVGLGPGQAGRAAQRAARALLDDIGRPQA